MKTVGLIGFPLGHSFSKRFFTNKFEEENICAQYLNFEIPDISLFPALIEKNPTIAGLNVTIPYKEKIIPFLHETTPEAADIGAVNVIKFIRKGDTLILQGHNSDVTGFKESIKPLIQPFHKKALILGTGGAAKAVEYGLKELNIQYTYVSRTKKNDTYFTYDELSAEIMNEYSIIINCTPLGTYPKTDEFPPIPYHLLSNKHLLYDLVYNPPKTQFLLKGEASGATIKNGEEMLQIQALCAWEIWNK